MRTLYYYLKKIKDDGCNILHTTEIKNAFIILGEKRKAKTLCGKP